MLALANENKFNPEGYPVQSNPVECGYPDSTIPYIEVGGPDNPGCVQITVPVWPGVDPQVTHVRVFRTTDGGATFYWLADMPLATITNLIKSGSTATVTTAAAHGLTTGQTVTMDSSDARYNGVFVATVASPTTFTFPLAGTAITTAAATGFAIGAYTDTTSDEGLAQGGEILRTQQAIPATGKTGCVFADRLFTCGFDPITAGTANVTQGSPSVVFSTALPDGAPGCWFQVAGDTQLYRVLSLSSDGLTATLDRPYALGSNATAGYSVFRYPWEIYYSAFEDPEANGPQGEAYRYCVELPGHENAIALVPFGDQCLCFASGPQGDVIYEIHVNVGGTLQTDVILNQFPLTNGYGIVCPDAFKVVENELHFMSHVGPAMMKLEGTLRLLGFPRYLSPPVRTGDKLLTDWFDSLSETELQLCRVGSDLLNVWFDVPTPGGLENSLRYRYNRRFQSWWQEGFVNASCYCNDFDANGLPGQCFYGQGATLIQARAPNVTYDLSTLASTAIASSTTTSLTVAGNLFSSANIESYAHVFDASGNYVGSRRIISLTGLNTINWSHTAAGGGYLTIPAGCTVIIGPIWMRWLTKSIYAPGKQTNIKD